MWEEIEARIAENDSEGPVPLRRELLEALRAADVRPVPGGATKKMVGMDLPGGNRLVWAIEQSAKSFFVAPKWHDLLGRDGFSCDLRPFVHGEKEGKRHSGLNRSWSFPQQDCLKVQVESPAELRRMIERICGNQAPKALNPAAVTRWITRLRQFFPDLDRFDRPDPAFDSQERDYKLQTAERMRAGIAAAGDDAELLAVIHDGLVRSNLLPWRAFWSMSPKGDGDATRIAAALRALVDAAQGSSEHHPQALADFADVWAEAVPNPQRDHARQIGEFVLMHLSPDAGIYIRHTVREALWREGYDEKFPASRDLAEIYRNERAFMQAVRDAFAAQGLAPRDMIDIQSALWVVHSYSDEDAVSSAEPEMQMSEVTPTTNLILYGPPGTGKTFATAAEAVRLCGEPVPQDRAELMETYHRLLAAGRIEFVTFHQSMSYEDFVEGRQPVTGADGDGEAESAGFRLETVHGIFRRIAKRAETSRGSPSGIDRITLENRQVFKMSIGRANLEEAARFFEEAIEGGYTLLGWENIDWTDERYSNAAEILATCQKDGTIPGEVNAQSGQVQHTDIFRNRMKVGDVIIVSKGNSLFRAIGEVTGDYEYSPRPEGVMCHRRAVKWLWVDADGVPVEEIYRSNFIQPTIYRLKKDSLNIPALERYLNSGRPDGPADPEPFVLIIDEINRANISKVFGELITLLEADKRLNQPNALRVRLPYSGDEFGVPSNLHILGTMNTADRSIALLDTALRRRFTFREMMPDVSRLEDAGQKCGIDLPRLLATINERIEYLYDREHQVGHAYFSACSSRADVDEVMRHKVIPLLAEYFFEDWAKIAAVLGDLEAHDGPISGGFLNRSILKSPPGFEDADAVPRFRWEVRSVDEGFDYGQLVGA